MRISPFPLSRDGVGFFVLHEGQRVGPFVRTGGRILFLPEMNGVIVRARTGEYPFEKAMRKYAVIDLGDGQFISGRIPESPDRPIEWRPLSERDRIGPFQVRGGKFFHSPQPSSLPPGENGDPQRTLPEGNHGPEETAGTRSLRGRSLPPRTGSTWRSVGAGTILGVAGGLASLGITKTIEHYGENPLGSAAHLGISTGTGTAVGIGTSLLLGQSVTLTNILLSIPTGFVTTMPMATSVALSEQMMGINPSSTEGIVGSIAATSLLAAAASHATLPTAVVTYTGAQTAAGAGLTLTGVGLGVGASIVVGGTALAGTGIGIGLDHGYGRLCNSDGDGTMSGLIAKELHENFWTTLPQVVFIALSVMYNASRCALKQAME